MLFVKLWTDTTLTDWPLLKLDLGLPPGFALESRIPEDVLVDNSFVQRNIHRVSGRKRWWTMRSSLKSSEFILRGDAELDCVSLKSVHIHLETRTQSGCRKLKPQALLHHFSDNKPQWNTCTYQKQRMKQLTEVQQVITFRCFYE